jgi:hypothetical protein
VTLGALEALELGEQLEGSLSTVLSTPWTARRGLRRRHAFIDTIDPQSPGAGRCRAHRMIAKNIRYPALSLRTRR